MEQLNEGDTVEYSIDDLRSMRVEKLAKVACNLGIDVSGLKNRNQVLTRLMESATDVSLIH